MLPWQVAQVEEVRGARWATTGGRTASPRIGTCSTRFFAITTNKGLSKRRLAPEELFAPETLEQFRI